MIKIYVDIDILSRLMIKENNNKIEKNQLLALYKLCTKDKLKFVVSGKILEEFINKQKNLFPLKIHSLFKILHKIPPLENEDNTGLFDYSILFYTDQIGESTKNNKFYSTLKDIFKPKDAENIYYAIRENCDYFLTLQKVFILDRVESHFAELKELLKNVEKDIEFIAPETLLEVLKNN